MKTTFKNFIAAKAVAMALIAGLFFAFSLSSSGQTLSTVQDNGTPSNSNVVNELLVAKVAAETVQYYITKVNTHYLASGQIIQNLTAYYNMNRDIVNNHLSILTPAQQSEWAALQPSVSAMIQDALNEFDHLTGREQQHFLVSYSGKVSAEIANRVANTPPVTVPLQANQ